MRLLRRFSPRSAPLPLAALLLLLASSTLAQNSLSNAPELSTATETSKSAAASTTDTAASKQTTDATSTGSSASAAASSVFQLTSVPTIAGASIPTAVVPYTANAPYMQKSSMPSGAVFIIVGAIIGFGFASILAWRGFIAWSLHRSVRRAADQSYTDTKNPLIASEAKGPRTTMYAQANRGSTLSMDHISKAAHRASHIRQSHVSRRGSTGGGKPPSSLFFSPTAGTGLPSQNPHHSLGVHPNRSSTYLPAGYYASGASAPPASTTLGGTEMHSHRHSTNPLGFGLGGPRSSGYARADSYAGISPPDSPVSGGGPPSRGGESAFNGSNSRPSSSVMGMAGGTSLYERPSSSSLNLMSPRGGTPLDRLNVAPAPGERAPSAYLEDLFDNHGHAMR